MRRRSMFALGLVGIAVVLAAVAAIAIGQADPAARPSPLNRYAANFTAFGFELATEAAPAPNGQGGLVIYDQDVVVTTDNVLFVTISATGDTHDGARLQLACNVDDQPCQPGAGDPAGGAPTGWFTASRHENYNDDYVGEGYAGDGGGGAGDLHDNAIYYTWCARVSHGTRNVKIQMASSPAPGAEDTAVPNTVFLEAVHFYIDGARIRHLADRCHEQNPLAAARGAEPQN
jgi:hypothetical protein